MILALLGLHLVAALLAAPLVRRLGSSVFAVLALAPAATAVWAATQVGARTSAGGGPHLEQHAWVPELGMELSFRLDTLAWVMTMVVSGVGALILLYCARYFDDPGEEPGSVGLLAASLVGFAGAMLGLVTTDDLLILYTFWEITTVLSYLLIGYASTDAASTRAAKQALVVTTAGGLAMLVGVVMLGEAADTYRISEIIATPPEPSPAVVAAVALLLAGAVTKSAQIPFHFWLPGAMAAPTPVSAYLHAAAMVKAGVYLVARLAPGFADLPAWQWTLLVMGGGTMLLGGFRATRQTDLKLLLAYGTVSQLGLLTLLLGYGNPGATLAGLTLLVAHALFKSALFLTVGTIDHSAGTRDIRKLRGVARRAPWLAVAGVLGALSMAGLGVVVGFVGKEAALGAVLHPVDGWASLQGAAAVAVVLGSVLTMAYSTRFVWGAFTDGGTRDVAPTGATPLDDHGQAPSPAGQGGAEVSATWHAPSPVLVAVPLTLGVAGVALGLASGPLERLLEPHTSTADLRPDGYAVHLGLWHGLTLPLLVSVAVWTLGALWWAAQRRRRVTTPRPLVRVDAGTVYQRLMRTVDRVALEVTGFLQRGSLPVLIGTILVVLVAMPGYGLLRGGVAWPDEVRWGESPAQIAIGVLVVLAALLATRARRRLRAVFLVGVTGYGTALLFLLHGAPDLALTQLLVETVSLVVIVLVLRRLSGRFPDDPSRLTRRMRALIGVAVAGVLGAVALSASAARVHEPAGAGLAERAVDYGGGANVVNVILVDVRAWDTMGELSVVLAAATGVASLVFLRDDAVQDAARRLRSERDRRAALSRGTADPAGRSRWITGAARLSPERRSTIFEVVTRLVFHVIMLWSLYLLFSGHNMPGGGFAAGLVAGLALALRYLAGRGYELRAALPVMPAVLLGSGLAVAALSAVLPMLLGSPALRTWITDVHLPGLGSIHIVTSLLFDIGVYLVVVGLMLDVLRSLGSRLDEQIEREREAAA